MLSAIQKYTAAAEKKNPSFTRKSIMRMLFLTLHLFEETELANCTKYKG